VERLGLPFSKLNQLYRRICLQIQCELLSGWIWFQFVAMAIIRIRRPASMELPVAECRHPLVLGVSEGWLSESLYKTALLGRFRQPDRGRKSGWACCAAFGIKVLRMPRHEFHLRITSEKYLDYYRGRVTQVIVRSSTGQTIQFPASLLQKFVTPGGIDGKFVLTSDDRNKIVGLEAVDRV
jgi:hypothetical protein